MPGTDGVVIGGMSQVLACQDPGGGGGGGGLGIRLELTVEIAANIAR